MAPELVTLLRDSQLDKDVRESIAAALGQLGERAVVPELVTLLRDSHLDTSVRGRIVAALGQLTNDEEMIRALFALLQTIDIQDDIYAALWDISRRINVRIIVKDTAVGGKEIELLKW